MLDLGWSELLLIGVVALIVVGPKDLPVMFRNLGRIMGKARSMAREFSQAMNAAADDAGMKDLKRDLANLSNPRSAGLDAVQEAADAFEKWDPEIDPDPPATPEPGPAATPPGSAGEDRTPAPAVSEPKA